MLIWGNWRKTIKRIRKHIFGGLFDRKGESLGHYRGLRFKIEDSKYQEIEFLFFLILVIGDGFLLLVFKV